jgi:hypothetical protein
VNEMNLLQELGTELDPPDGVPPARLRTRVLAPPPPAQRPRLAWRLALAGGLAAALTVSVVAASGGRDQGRHGASPGQSAPHDAAVVLQLAALAAQQETFIPPRPDQFVFNETKVPLGKQPGDPPFVVRAWLSADGTHDGLVRGSHGGPATSVVPGCRDGKRAAVKVEGRPVVPPQNCTPDPVYQPDLPTDADGMLAWLRTAVAAKDPNGPDFIVFKVAGGLLTRDYLTPQSQAAIYQALAKVPGVTLRPDVVDGAGRHGLGVGISLPGGQKDTAARQESAAVLTMIFDPKTYEFLGTPQTALVRKAIVDRVDQLP